MTRYLTFMLVLLLVGCDVSSKSCAKVPSNDIRRADLTRQKISAEYEVELRKAELNEMMQVTHRPGIVGVSTEWLQRKNELKEKILQAQLKANDLKVQLEQEP